MALGIVGNALVAEIDAVFEHAGKCPHFAVVAVIKASGEPVDDDFKVHALLIQRIDRCDQLLAVIAVDDELKLSDRKSVV